MARLQILQLPADHRKDGSGETPYILVIDQASEDIAKTLDPQDQVASYGTVMQRLAGLSLAEQIGARAVLVFRETADIPASGAEFGNSGPAESEGTACADVPGCDGDCCATRNIEKELKATSEVNKRLTADRDEARMWARHGYEIGQRHCGWSDHGVAPDWLTEGWPYSFDSCEHLKQAAELEETITRVRAVSTEPEAMNADQERPDVWVHGYGIGVRAAKAALNPRNEPTVKP
jgi:hypothetical protein